jgi:hypothetical protein
MNDERDKKPSFFVHRSKSTVQRFALPVCRALQFHFFGLQPAVSKVVSFASKRN